jgi:3-isopropylmalate dehydrogenase
MELDQKSWKVDYTYYPQLRRCVITPLSLKKCLSEARGIDAAGASLPEKTLEACQSADAILLGAIGGPKWEKAQDTPEKGLLALRKSLNLFANIRPVAVSSALVHLSPFKA